MISEDIPKGFYVYEVYIGVDTGTTTAIAVYYPSEDQFQRLESGGILDMMDIVLEYKNNESLLIRIEDARKRGHSGKDAAARAQGAGSVKRDGSIWEEFCEKYDLNYELVPPQSNLTKVDQQTFRRMTGWSKRTNQHKRDAGMLVYGY